MIATMLRGSHQPEAIIEKWRSAVKEKTEVKKNSEQQQNGLL